MRFEQRIEVGATPEKVWEFLWDFERLARCLPGCKEVKEVEPHQRYEVTVEERVGPFKVRFEMDVQVTEQVPQKLVRLRALGADKKMGASNRVELEVTLEPLASGGTGLDVVADIQVMGRIASLGQVMIKRKAHDVVEKFARAIAEQLDTVPSG